MRHSVTFQIALSQAARKARTAAAKSLDFEGQPVFPLACVGVGDPDALAPELDRLRGLYARWAPVTRQMVAA